MILSTEKASKIHTPVEDWLSNYPNEGFFEIKNIRKAPEGEDGSDVFYDLWFVGTNLEEQEKEHLVADSNDLESIKCCWEDYSSLGEVYHYKDYLDVQDGEEAKDVGRRFIKYTIDDGIQKLGDGVYHRHDDGTSQYDTFKRAVAPASQSFALYEYADGASDKYVAQILFDDGELAYERAFCPYEDSNVYQTPAIIYDFTVSVITDICQGTGAG